MVTGVNETFDLRTREERFATLWDDILIEHGEERGQLPASKLGVEFTECLDPDPDEWSIGRVFQWVFSAITFAAFLMMCFSLYDGKFATLWMSLFVIAAFLTWYSYQRRNHPNNRQLERCLATKQQFEWYVRLEKRRSDYELGKKSALPDPDEPTGTLPAARFEGLEGLRLIVRSGSMGAATQGGLFFTELEVREVHKQGSDLGIVEQGGEQSDEPQEAFAESPLPMQSGVRKRSERPHPFEIVVALYFPDFLKDFLDNWDKPQAEKDQFRALNLVLFDLISTDPNMSIKDLIRNVRELTVAYHGIHLQYSDNILAKIVGKSAEGPYGAFKKYLLERSRQLNERFETS